MGTTEVTSAEVEAPEVGANTDQSKKEHKRSASYPSLTVEGAFEFSKKIYNKFTAEQTVNRKEIATALDVHENTVSREVAAAVQYGFVSKSPNEGYKLTALFTNLLSPENQKEKKLLFLEAFGKPKLNQEIISKMDGLPIPEEFPNSLIRHHNIAPNAAKLAADVFINSAQFVGAIGENGENRILRYKVTLSTVTKTQYAEVIDETHSEGNHDANSGNNKPVVIQPQDAQVSPSDKKVPMYLTKDKMAYLVYPPNITANDVKLIEHQLQGIIMRINFEADEEKKGDTSPQ